MYQVGDKVVYGVHGICMIVAQEQRVIDRKTVTYLALEPIGQEGARYLVPTHNGAAMGKIKHILSREELEALMESESVLSGSWIWDENLRKKTYRELISSGDRAGLMQMMHTLYQHRDARKAAGKKIHLCDEIFLRDAEKLLAGEFSIVLGMVPEQAKQYLRNKLKGNV